MSASWGRRNRATEVNQINMPKVVSNAFAFACFLANTSCSKSRSFVALEAVNCTVSKRKLKSQPVQVTQSPSWAFCQGMGELMSRKRTAKVTCFVKDVLRKSSKMSSTYIQPRCPECRKWCSSRKINAAILCHHQALKRAPKCATV